MARSEWVGLNKGWCVMRRRLCMHVIFVVLLAYAVGGLTPVAGGAAPRVAQAPAARFVAAACPFRVGTGLIVGQDVFCGLIVVSKERTVSGSPAIGLAVAVFR